MANRGRIATQATCRGEKGENTCQFDRLTPLSNWRQIGYTSTMATALLQTKFYRPRIHANLVPRPHLIERLTEGLQNGHSLMLISAPAGYGKTTLVAAWLWQLERRCATALPFRCAWLSLDPEEGI